MDAKEPELSETTGEERGGVRATRKTGRPTARLRPPWVTLALIASNLLMAFAQWAAGGYLWRDGDISSAYADWALGAKVPSLIAHGEFWRLVTASFLHASWFHLSCNMIGLLTLGRLVETFYGHARMLVIYVISCVAGFVASYLLTPSVSLGASTGVLGLMGALLYHNLKYRAYLPSRLNYIYPVLLLLVVIQFAMDLHSTQVDMWAHVGGFIGGIVMGALVEGRIVGEQQAARDWLPLPTALATAGALLLYGTVGLVTSLPASEGLLKAATTRSRRAQAELVRGVVERRPYFLEARLMLGHLWLQTGREADAAAEYRVVMRYSPGNPDARRAMDLLAATYLQQAEMFFRTGAWEEAALYYRRAADAAVNGPLKSNASNGYAWTLADKLNRQLDDAETYAKQALKGLPKSDAITDTLAWVYFRKGRYEDALKIQLQAVRLSEKSPTRGTGEQAELFYHLGAIYEKLGRKDEAITNYAKALRLRPTYLEATEALQRLSAPGTRDEPFQFPGDDPAVQRGVI